MLLYMGLLCTIGGWSSSYAILKGIDSKQDAVIYPTMFFASLTVSRLFLAFVPGSCRTKMIYTLSIIAIVSIISLGL